MSFQLADVEVDLKVTYTIGDKKYVEFNSLSTVLPVEDFPESVEDATLLIEYLGKLFSKDLSLYRDVKSGKLMISEHEKNY